MTVRALTHRGDGTYFLSDRAPELAGLTMSPPGVVRRGLGEPSEALAGVLGNGGVAIDLVIAAPKAVSLLLALEQPPRARQVVELHLRATAAALDYLEAAALQPSELQSLSEIAFTHGVSRRLDPHLHTHVVMGARGASPSGLHAALRRHARAADALYLAVLRDGLPATTGRTAWVDHRGATRVERVDVGLIAATSAPRDRAGRVVREGDKPRADTATIRAGWRAAIAAAPALGAPPRPSSPRGRLDEYRLAATLGMGVVGPSEVLAATAAAATYGAPAGVLRAAAAALAKDLGGAGRAPAIRVLQPAAVRALGARPLDAAGIETWQGAAAALRKETARMLCGARGQFHGITDDVARVHRHDEE